MKKIILPRKIAHRGASKVAPENTLSAIYTAKELGARWVEFDVMLSGDRIPMIFHDETLSRTTNGSGQFSSFSCMELKKLDAGSWFSKEYVGEHVPTLTEMLVLCANLNLGINIELKTQGNQGHLLVSNVLDEVRARWPSDLDPPMFSSFDMSCLFYLRRLDANCHISVLYHEWDELWEKQADELQATSVNLNVDIATPFNVNQIILTGRQIACYTVNTMEKAKQLFEIGVNSVFTDYADLAVD